MTNRSYRSAVLLSILIFVLSTLPASAESKVYLPLISNGWANNAIRCHFYGNPIWLDVFVSIDVPATDNQPYIVTDENGNTIIMHDTGGYRVGETHQLTYPIIVRQVDDIFKQPASDRVWTERCRLQSMPQPPSGE